jgi:hypothetical protein
MKPGKKRILRIFFYLATMLSILRPWEGPGDVSAARQEAEAILAASPGPLTRTGDIATLRLTGSPYARGYVHGRVMAGSIREMDAILNQLMDAKAFHLPMLGKTMAARKARWLEARTPPECITEMYGIADGAGVPYLDILLFNVFDDLLYVHGCSSLGLEQGPASVEWVHARNLDYILHQLARQKLILVYDTPGHRYLTVGFPGYIGVLTGFNDRGISLSAHTSISSESAVGVPSGFLYRRIMEEAGTLEQAAGILRAGPRTIGNNILLGSFRENAFLGVEVTAARCETRSPDGGVITMTNHYQCDAMRDVQRGSNRLLQGSRQRAGILRQFAAGLGRPATVADVQKWFASRKGEGMVFPSVANGGTVQGVIFAPAEGAFFVAKGNKTPVTLAGYTRFPLPFPVKE